MLKSSSTGAANSVRLLLNYGANPDETDDHPFSCVQLAASCGHLQIVEMLLNAGASLTAPTFVQCRSSPRKYRGRQQKDASRLAKLHGYVEVAQFIEEWQGGLIEKSKLEKQ